MGLMLGEASSLCFFKVKQRVILDRPRGRRRARSAWRGEEIEGDDEDEHDWEKTRYFSIVLVVVVVLDRPGVAKKSRATTRTSTIGEGGVIS
jgi:hypothetical protein